MNIHPQHVIIQPFQVTLLNTIKRSEENIIYISYYLCILYYFIMKYNLDKEAALFIDRINHGFFYQDYLKNGAKSYHDTGKEDQDVQTFLDCMLLDFPDLFAQETPYTINVKYSELLDPIYFETMKNRYKMILEEMIAFIEKGNHENNLIINTNLLSQAILDYFLNIQHLKSIYNVYNVNTDIIYADTAFWLLRKKPIQVIPTLNHDEITIPNQKEAINQFLFINEEFVAFQMISNLLSDLEINPFLLKTEETHLTEFYNHLLYYFKNYDFTSSHLELMVKGFRSGYTIGKRK